MTTNLVHLENGHAVTSSLQIAEIFEKQHKNILQSIDYLVVQLDKPFAELNFQLTYEIKQIGNTERKTPYYNLTRDAFVLLAMGFTGSKALQFKLAYLNAFNQLEQHVIHHQSALVDLNSRLKDRLMTQHLRYRQVYRYLSRGFVEHEIAACMKISGRAVRLIKAEMRDLELLPEQEVFVLAHTGKIARTVSPIQLGLLEV